jgi:bifunctional DNA-binding transcriptional regulator/antitoxin component of YhaV-PrlF toxin-antitoxin module
MPRKRSIEINIRKLTKVGAGRSYSITLPIRTIREFRWRERQRLLLEIDKRKKTILIKDWKKK